MTRRAWSRTSGSSRQVDLIAGPPDAAALLRDATAVHCRAGRGAAKKAFAVAQRFGLPLLTASKVRDTATGAITRTELQDPGAARGGGTL